MTERHTAIDYAHALKHVADEMFPHAEIVLVQDNLNTHKPASLYQAFEAKEARRLTERLEWHYTPKHGSWLDLAESELSVLSSQCLDRRIGDIESLRGEVEAGSQTATKTKPRPIGSSQPTTPESNSRRSTRSFPVKMDDLRH